MLYARTPGEWGEWTRWCHLPLFVCITSIVLFLQLYFGTGVTVKFRTTITPRKAMIA